MPQLPHEHNPFLLMVNPEVVFAAMEASERLGQLNRHTCRPLDRLLPLGADATASVAIDDGEDGEFSEDSKDGEDEAELPPEV